MEKKKNMNDLENFEENIRTNIFRYHSGEKHFLHRHNSIAKDLNF